MPCVHIITTPKLLLFFVCVCVAPPHFLSTVFLQEFFFPSPPRDRGGGSVIKRRPVAIGEGGVAMSDALSKAALFWVAAAALQRSRGLQEIRL